MGKTSQYHMTENFIAFWYRYVFSVRTEIERGNGDIYFSLALEDLSHFIGPIFEEVTRQYLRRKNAQGAYYPLLLSHSGHGGGKIRRATYRKWASLSSQYRVKHYLLENVNGVLLLKLIRQSRNFKNEQPILISIRRKNICLLSYR